MKGLLDSRAACLLFSVSRCSLTLGLLLDGWQLEPGGKWCGLQAYTAREFFRIRSERAWSPHAPEPKFLCECCEDYSGRLSYVGI